MVSNLKRYNNTVQKLMSVIRHSLKFYQDWRSAMYIYASFDKTFFESVLTLQLNFDYTALVVDQDKNKDIYIGLDLNKVHFMTGKNESKVAECVLRTVKWCSEFSSAHDDLMMEISPETKDTLSEANVQNTDFYKRLLNHISDLNQLVKIDATLDEGQFPTLGNRKMLPLLIIKIDKRQINFTQSISPKSYKSDRVVYDLGDVMNSYKIKEICGSLSIPANLVKIELSGGHIHRTSS